MMMYNVYVFKLLLLIAIFYPHQCEEPPSFIPEDVFILYKNGKVLSLFGDDDDYQTIEDNYVQSFKQSIVGTQFINGSYTNFSDSMCYKHAFYILQKISNKSDLFWLAQLVDSFGKIDSGLTKGTTFWPGDFDICQSIKVKPEDNQLTSFRGQYCKARWMSTSNELKLYINSGICIPKSCADNDFISTQFINHLPLIKMPKTLKLVSITCQVKESIQASELVFIIVLITFLIFPMLATLIDFCGDKSSSKSNHLTDEMQNLKREEQFISRSSPSTICRVILCFSLKKNLCKILSFQFESNDLKSIHGLRAISTISVFFIHLVNLGKFYYRNPIDLFNPGLNKFMYWAVQHSLAVDTFFTISGLLLAYKFFIGSKRINLINFYLHRYIRLTPVVAICVTFIAFIFHHLSSGPYWDDGNYPESARNVCRSYWFAYIFHFSNLNFKYGSCLPPAWSVGADFQFYSIAPIFLFLLNKNALHGTLFAILIVCTSFIYRLYTASIGNFSKATGIHADINYLVKYGFNRTNWDEKHSIEQLYTLPHSRIGPFLIGILIGYVLVKYCKSKTLISPLKTYLLLLIALILCTYSSLFTCIHNPDDEVGKMLYLACFRIFWSIGIGLTLLACCCGCNNLLKSLFELSIWLPLSRSSYSFFLVHSIVLNFILSTAKRPIDVSGVFELIFTISTFTLSFIASLIVCVLFELPFIRLMNIVCGRKTIDKQPTQEGSKNV